MYKTLYSCEIKNLIQASLKFEIKILVGNLKNDSHRKIATIEATNKIQYKLH